ncbi:MAG TPA: outer membrane lipoprotein-sorting protein [Pseudobdellovibrionaceae bacterium]|jgi:hypothetical protein
MLVFLMISFLFFGTLPARAALAAPLAMSLNTITQEISNRLKAKDEEFDGTMKIIEADQSFKERGMKILRLSPSPKEHYIMVRMKIPKDLKGISLLATYKGGKEEKWLYLPSNKQTRRLASTSKESGSILGSELNPEDFNISTESSAKNILKKEVKIQNQSYYVIESDVSPVSKNYSKIISYVTTHEFLPNKSECYDKQGKLLKVIEFSNYKKLGNGKWRAEKIKIRNVQNKRATEVALSNIKVDQELKASEFTPKALSDD